MTAHSEEISATVEAICRHCGTQFQAMTLLGKQVAGCCSDECTNAVIEAIEPKPVAAETEDTKQKVWRSICPPRYAAYDFSKLPAQGKAIAARVLAWQAQNASRGIAIIGPSDRGKSMLIHEVARIAFFDGFDVHVTSSTEFAYAMQSPDFADRRIEIDRAVSCGILLFDDVGKEKMTERVESDFYHVLEQRERWGRIVLFTGNSKGADLEGGMSEDRGSPIVNRLRRLAEVIAT